MKINTDKHTVTLPIKDYEELKRPRHEELQQYLLKLIECSGIVITGIDLNKHPSTCNKNGKNSYIFTSV